MTAVKPVQGNLKRRQFIAASGLAAGAMALLSAMRNAAAQTTA